MRTTWMRRAAVALGLLVLAGCGSSSYGGGSAASSGSSSSASSGGGTSNAVLKTASSDLGQIVVAADGRTVYVFDKDTPGSGTSACTGGCTSMWPAVTAQSDAPAVDGVKGQVGTITRADGTKQVTLAGMPLYMYSGDSQAGDVKGQAVLGIWWVVGPDGKKIATAAASSSSAPAAIPGY